LSFEAAADVTHQAPSEWVKMNKYHLAFRLELLEEQHGPSIKDVGIAFALFIGVLFSLFPAEFKEYGGISASVWEAMAIILTGGSAIVTCVLFGLWAYNTYKYPHKSTLEVVDEIIEDMNKDIARLQRTGKLSGEQYKRK